MLIIVSLIALAISFGGGRIPPDLLALQTGQTVPWLPGGLPGPPKILQKSIFILMPLFNRFWAPYRLDIGHFFAPILLPDCFWTLIFIKNTDVHGIL